MNETVCVKTSPELETINNQLSELNNLAVDIGLRVRQFNSRVQGDFPRDAESDANKKPSVDCMLNGIRETISYLRSSLNEIDSETARLDAIG